MKARIIEYRWIAIATLFFWLILVFTPPEDIDFDYMRQMLSEKECDDPLEGFYSMAGEKITTPQQWITSVRNHYIYHDNSRLANYLAMGQSIIPHWGYDLFIAVCYALLLTMMLNLSGQSRKSAGAVAAMALAIWWFFNWDAPMLCIDYLLNYTFSGAMVLCFVWLVTRPRRRSTILMIILAVIAGMSHEGFSVSFGAGLFCWLLINRREVSRQQIALCIIFFLSAAFVTFSPALMWRLSSSIESDRPVTHSAIPLLRDNLILSVTIIAVIITAVKRPKLLRNQTVIVMAVTAVCAIVIYFVSKSMPRALWPEQTALTVILFSCLRPKWFVPKVVAVGLWTILIMWLSSLLYWQIRLERDNDFLLTASGRIFYRDFVTLNDTPLWLGAIPAGPGTYSGGFYGTLGERFNSIKGYDDRVFLPSIMADNDTAMSIPGTAGLHGRFPFFTSTESLPENFDVEITFGPANILKCKNIASVTHGLLKGTLLKPITTTICFTRIATIVTDNDTVEIYSNQWWYLGSNDYGRKILRADTIASDK